MDLGAIMVRNIGGAYDSSPTMFLPIDNDFDDGLFTLQGVEAIATRNRAPGGVGSVATKTGDVVFAGSHVEGVGGSAYLNTLFNETETYSAFVVVATDATFSGGANQPAPFGNFGPNGTSLFAINHSSLPAPACRWRWQMTTTGGNNIATINMTDATQYAFLLGRVSPTACEIDDLTHPGISGDAPAVTGTRALEPRKMRLLSTYSGSFGGGCKVAAAGYFPNQYFSLDLGKAIRAKIAAYLARPSINIIC